MLKKTVSFIAVTAAATALAFGSPAQAFRGHGGDHGGGGPMMAHFGGGSMPHGGNFGSTHHGNDFGPIRHGGGLTFRDGNHHGGDFRGGGHITIGHHPHRRYHRGDYRGGFGIYIDPFPYDYGYYDGYPYANQCSWLHHRWRVTHKRYWLNRYERCLGY